MWGLDPTESSPLKDQYPALEFVPCPGDAGNAQRIAAIVTRTAKALDQISDVLHGTGDGDWKGKHAEEFRRQFDDTFRPRVDQAKRSFAQGSQGADWLVRSHARLAAQGRDPEQRAQDKKDEMAALKGKLADRPPKPLSFDAPKDDAEECKREKTEKDRSSAELAASTAEADLDKLRAQARKLASDFALEGQSVARRLDKAMDIAPNEPGALDKLGSALKGIGKALGAIDDLVADVIDSVVDGAVKWIKENAYALAAIGDVLSVLNAVTGAVSLVLLGLSVFFPPLAVAAGAIGVISGGLALGALAIHSTVRATTDDPSFVSNRTLAQDSLGVLPFGGAFKGISSVVAGSRAADSAANFGLIDSVASLMGDPTALGYFAPDSSRQAAEMSIPGGPLLIEVREKGARSGLESVRRPFLDPLLQRLRRRDALEHPRHTTPEAMVLLCVTDEHCRTRLLLCSGGEKPFDPVTYR